MRELSMAYTRLRQDGLASLLGHVRLVALRRMHKVLWDGRLDAREANASGGFLAKGDLAPAEAAKVDESWGYLPTERRVLRWLLEGVAEDLSSFTFIDFGSGPGRVLLSAAVYPFKAVLGVEFVRSLHEQAVANIANHDQNLFTCKDIHSICADALAYDLPEGDCILYLFNPFDEDLMRAFVDRIAAARRKKNGRVILIYYNPVYARVLDEEPRFERKPLSMAANLKMKLFGPYQAITYELARR